MNSLIEQKSDLAAYLKMINSFPMLSAEEEHDLAVKFHETGDKRSAYRLVTVSYTHLTLPTNREV